MSVTFTPILPQGRGILGLTMIRVSFNTKRKGVIVETGVMYALQKLGLAVSKPEGDNEPYDLILDLRTDRGNFLKKIQCKTASVGNYSISISTKATNYKGGKTCKHFYSNLDIDYFATIYRDIPILIPIENCPFGKSSISIPLQGDSNNSINHYILKDVLEREYGEIKEIESDFSWVPIEQRSKRKMKKASFPREEKHIEKQQDLKFGKTLMEILISLLQVLVQVVQFQVLVSI